MFIFLFAHFKNKYEIINKFNQIKFQGNLVLATSPCSPIDHGHLSCVVYHVHKNCTWHFVEIKEV